MEDWLKANVEALDLEREAELEQSSILYQNESLRVELYFTQRNYRARGFAS
jgi:hypothetical protein